MDKDIVVYAIFIGFLGAIAVLLLLTAVSLLTLVFRGVPV